LQSPAVDQEESEDVDGATFFGSDKKIREAHIIVISDRSPHPDGQKTTPEVVARKNLQTSNRGEKSEELEILREMQEIKDYNSHVPEQGSTLTLSASRPGSCLNKSLAKQTNLVEFKALPSRVLKMGGQTLSEMISKSGNIKPQVQLMIGRPSTNQKLQSHTSQEP